VIGAAIRMDGGAAADATARIHEVCSMKPPISLLRKHVGLRSALFLPVLLLFWTAVTACVAQASPTPAIPTGAAVTAEQSEAVLRLIEVLEERYVFPDVAQEISDSLRLSLDAGEFDRPEESEAFAERVSQIIRGVSGDGHLWVMASSATPPPARGPDTPESLEQRRRNQARSNFGFASLEILDGNVGYLELRQFVAPVLAGETATAAVRFLSNSDALIIDLRQNAGGSSDMVLLLASYLLGAEPVHLFDQYLRPEGRTEQHWTMRYLPGRALDRQPLFILTHSRTFSAPEALAYLLKHQGRATVVGEQTAGGANPGAFHRIGERWLAFVAEARITSPVTHDNWEGRGVTPHVPVGAEEALGVAHRLALLELLEREEAEDRREELMALLASMDRP
jgi:retinol-binding protein 3